MRNIFLGTALLFALFISYGNSLECYYCDLDIFHDCDDSKYGNPVTCQFTNSSEPHYGNACVISHSEGQAGELWERKCVDSESIPGIMGCNDTDAGGVKTHRCKCNTDLCNEKFTDTTIYTTPPTMSTSSSQPEEALQCYYCDGTLGIGCNDKDKGKVVTCQMKSSKEQYYGDVCAIGHTVNALNGTLQWRRTCKPRGESALGCSEHDAFHGLFKVDECLCETPLCNENMGAIGSTSTSSIATQTTKTSTKVTSTTPTTRTSSVISTTETTTVKQLQCFYCDSEICSDDHPGEIVTCQQHDPNADHYGHTCAIGHSMGETIVWGRDCYTPPDGYIGCREEQRHEKPAQVCYCDGDLCNARMEDISTTSTTTTPNVKELRCYACDEGDTPDCDSEYHGDHVTCQQHDPNGYDYGHTCMVAKVTVEGLTGYARGCYSPPDDFIGCRHQPGDHHPCNGECDVCYCDGDLCNAKMDDSVTTSTTTLSTTSRKDIMCYYCNPTEGECNEENPGDLVKCQEDDKLGFHFGDACVIGHTIEDGKTYWRRDCIDSEHMSVGCQKEGINGTEIEYCVCKEEGCNKEMGELPTSSTTPTTTQPKAELECYFCSFEEGECGVEVPGMPIKCQMNDPFGKHYGDACYVAHSDEEGEIKWSRDCTHNVNKTIGCQKRSWSHDGQETLIDECICDKDLCNKDMEAITSTTSKTTTPNGNGLECWFCLSDDHNLGDCNADHAGGIVSCSDNPESEHYGDKCAVGHTVTEDDQIWRRDCVKEDFIGCKSDKRDNGTHIWEIELCVCEEDKCNEKMGDIPTSSTAKTTTPEGSELECYFCQSDDHHLLEECNAEHPGGIVKCQQEDGDAPHFGRYCTVGHTVTGDEQIWRRDCSDGLPDGFLGCKKDTMNNGSMTWDIEMCICKENKCNQEMGDITTSPSPITTTTHQVEGIKCLSCGQEEGIECNSDHVGNEIHCQMENPELGNFGDACYVAHDVAADSLEEKWWRGCKSLVNQTLGCSRHMWMNHQTDKEIEVDECICKTDLCNEEMGPIPDTTTKMTSTTTKEWIGRQCYFCDETTEDCSADNYGERVHCQMEDSEAPHYGSDCAVGHTVDKESSKVIWRRNCIHRTSTEPLGCFEQNWNGGNVVVDECICDGDFCNDKLPEISTSTTKSTTTRGTALVCYECHDDECGEHEYGHGVTCQMENPEDEHYGDFCYVAHTVEEEMSWQRGCKIMVNQTIGCSQHKWFHDGKEQTVDECICKNNLCNKDIQPIPETTTPKGAELKCYYCGHEDEDCSAGASGIEITCQTSNEEEPHFGDSCYVGHSVEDEVSEEHWWRGCKMRDSIGCSEHKWLHHDHEYLVDECVCDTELCNKDMQPIPSSTTVKTTTPSGNELQCWFCLSDDHNLGDCNAEHAGSIVTCSDDPHSKHYGDKCGVGHTVLSDDQIWRRNCVKEDFIGCKGDKRDNGTHFWEIELCVCDEKLCNEKMGDIPSSSTLKTTTSEVTDLSCYYCNSGDLEHEECNAEEYGELVKCQYVDEKEDHYGNACVVGHTVNHEKIYWGRDCIDDTETQIGCEQKVYNGSEIEVCVCRGEGCNKEMGDVSTSTAKPTTTHKGNGLQCYYCLHYDECTADKPGELVECQMENPSEPHYGDACEVAHTVDSLKGNFWWRECKVKHEEPLICTEHKISHNDRDITYDECLCDTNECNREMGPIVTPTTTSTTLDPNRLECYYCFGHAGTEHDDCDVDEYGEKVVCQMHDPREPNYGDVCFVGHTETSDEAGSMTWRRGCEVRGSKRDGCQEYKWDNGNITVLECVCSDALCNKNVPDIPTTTPGTGLECYSCGHEEEECNKEHYGETVRCQMDDPENHNYGDSCYVGHSVHDDPSEEHWWRGCKSDHGESLGCTQHNFYHHDHEELVDECVCKEALCNREMGPIETTTSVSTTTIKGNGPNCYYCGHEEEDCNAEHHGLIVTCQMHDPTMHHYGDACYVGHSVHNDSSEESWWRGCKYDRDEPLGCTQHKFTHEDHEILVDECICKDDLCNEAMGPIPSPSTTPKTTTPKGTGLKCHYCFGHGGTEHSDCDAEMYGPAVECQMQNPTLPYFGDVCLVAHTESPDGERGEMTWNRGCHPARNGEPMGCRELTLGHNLTVIECLCDSELCNEKIDLTTSTSKPTTTEGVGLKCYECGHEDGQDCTMEKSGNEVRCQMNDAKQEHYGDNCYVGHTVIIGNDTGESVWWRGCTPLNDQKLGCTERKWNGTGKEILVDECICNDDLCNEDMQKFSTEKPTTIPDGLQCYFCDNSHSAKHHEDCSADMYGYQVSCQMNSKEEDNYGDACVVGHTVDNLNGSIIWRRGCVDSTDLEMGCANRVIQSKGIDVEACVCATSLCNEKMGDLPPNGSNKLNIEFMSIFFYIVPFFLKYSYNL